MKHASAAIAAVLAGYGNEISQEDALFDAESLDSMAEDEGTFDSSDILTSAGYEPNYTPVDTLMAAPCGLAVAEQMEMYL